MRLRRIQMKVRHLMALVGLGAMGALGLRLDTMPAGWGCGAFPLQVDLKVPAGRTVVAVEVGSEGSVERAESLVNAPGGPYANLEAVRWAAAGRFEVPVPCGYRLSLLTGRELSPWQHRALILRLEYSDGSCQWLVRAIPDHPLQQLLTVSVP